MIKSSCMEKCHILVGSIRDNSEIHLARLHKNAEDSMKKFSEREAEINDRIFNCSAKAKRKKQNLVKMLQRERKKNLKSIGSLQDKISYWKTSPRNYSVILEKFC